MSSENKVIWSEGMFLQQQHFQQQDRYVERLIESRTAPLAPYGWGFATLALDEAALGLGKLALSSASGLFPDGTPFDFPATDAAPLPLDIPPEARNQQVFLALPLRCAASREINLDLNFDLDRANRDNLLRYSAQELDVADNTASDNASEHCAAIQVGRLRMRFLLEKDRTDAYACLGTVRLIERRADNQLLLDQHYIRPTLNVLSNGPLDQYCKEICGMLHQLGEELAAQLGQPSRSGVAEIADFLLLQTVNRYEPAFLHYQQSGLLHPERLFLALLELAGDLSTFGSERRRVPIYPLYQHDNLESSFLPLMRDLRHSLGMVLHRSAVAIELQDKKYGVRLAVIPDRDLLKSASFVLAVNAQMPSETLRSRFPGQVKIGPVERIRDLVNLQLPGIPLHSMPVAPRQIPYHAGFTYFEVERGGELWTQLERSGGLAMHIAGDFPALELECWAIKEQP